MPLEKVLTFLRKRPFAPFRIHLSDGRTFDIFHPELVMAGRLRIYVGSPATDEPVPLVDHVEFIALIHIVSIEEIAPSQQAS